MSDASASSVRSLKKKTGDNAADPIEISDDLGLGEGAAVEFDSLEGLSSRLARLGLHDRGNHGVSKPGQPTTFIDRPSPRAKPTTNATTTTTTITLLATTPPPQTTITVTPPSPPPPPPEFQATGRAWRAPRRDFAGASVVGPDSGHTVYVLKCAGDKYYVGKTATSRLEERLREHWTGCGGYWTKTHQPHEVVEELCPYMPYMETAVTVAYMAQYGIDNVRGAQYVNAYIESNELESIKISMRHEKELCLICGASDHWVSECKAAQMAKLARKTKAGGTSKKAPQGRPCYRCGREGHWYNDCYAKTHVDGSRLG